MGVYFALSALDFPFCFLAVRLIGTDTIGHYEHIVVEGIKGVLKWPIQGTGLEVGVDGAVDKGAGGEEIKKVEKLLPGPLKSAFEKFVNSLPNEVLGEEGPTGPKMKNNWIGDEV